MDILLTNLIVCQSIVWVRGELLNGVNILPRHSLSEHWSKKINSIKKVMPRFELGSWDSESQVLTITPQDHFIFNQSPTLPSLVVCICRQGDVQWWWSDRGSTWRPWWWPAAECYSPSQQCPALSHTFLQRKCSDDPYVHIIIARESSKNQWTKSDHSS